MPRSPQFTFLYQLALALWILAVLSVNLVIASAFLFLGDPKTWKRPGINIKEF